MTICKEVWWSLDETSREKAGILLKLHKRISSKSGFCKEPFTYLGVRKMPRVGDRRRRVRECLHNEKIQQPKASDDGGGWNLSVCCWD
jgi:hypothetical protein